MPKLNLKLYQKLYLIRVAEKGIQEHYFENEMKTPMHMSMGEEAIVVGVCQALKQKDQVFASYRNHAVYLTKVGETNKFFAEMYGKITGTAKGKAGSMHLVAPKRGLLGTSAIVASIIPVAVGAAFANKIKRNGKIVAVFFGDGAIDEGNFWESLNVACLMKLPILFICEDNDLAVYTSAKERHGYKSITDIVAKFNCHAFKTDTTDVEVIYKLVCQTIKIVKKTKMPAFINLKYYRYLEHVGVNKDFDAGYRSKKEFERWYKKDPINLQREKLLKIGVKKEKIEKLEGVINRQVKESIKLAKKSALAKINVIYQDIFYENERK